MSVNSSSLLPKGKQPKIRQYLESLQATSHKIFEASLDGGNLAAVARSHHFVAELTKWIGVLGTRREVELISVAANEYEFAVLALSRGHYRHAFKALRLVLELSLQAIYLSANEIKLREWLANRRDTVWNAIVGAETDDGVFSMRFAEAFYPDLKSHLNHYRTLAVDVYRECSECVHGNVPTHVLLPKKLEFNQHVFDLWHEKAGTTIQVVHFALTLRYLKEIPRVEIHLIEPALTGWLSHIPEIRAEL